MSLHVIRYKAARSMLAQANLYEAVIASAPICSLNDDYLRRWAQLEEARAKLLPQLHRLKFLAKIDRSKYRPHQGLKERDRRNKNLDRPMCGYLDPTPITAEE